MATVYLGLGANLGNREANLRMALRGLGRMARLEAVSSLYEAEPAGGPEQPPFYHAVCRVDVGLEPRPPLRFLQSPEAGSGRRLWVRGRRAYGSLRSGLQRQGCVAGC